MWFSKYKNLTLVIKDKFQTKTAIKRRCLKSEKPSDVYKDIISKLDSDSPILMLEDEVSLFRIKKEDIIDWWITDEIYY